MRHIHLLLLLPAVLTSAHAHHQSRETPEIVVRDTNASAVVIEETALCTVSADGLVECDTASYVDPYVVPDDLGPVEALTLGKAHACAITINGDVRCFGNASSNFYGQLEVPQEASPAISISAGEVHTCAVNSGGRVVCWGLERNSRALPPDDGKVYVSVSSGEKHSCAVTVNNELVCWGAPEAVNPVPQKDAPAVTEVSASKDETCVLTVEGDIRCYNRTVNNTADVPLNGPFFAFSHAGGTDSGNIVCGLDGTGTIDCAVTPVRIIFDPNVASLAQELREAEARARLIEQAANQAGPFTSIDTAASFSFDAGSIVQVGANSYDVYGCGVRTDGKVACWQAPDGIQVSNELVTPDYIPPVSVSIYSSTSLELFWASQQGVRIGMGEAFFEVERNGELLPASFGATGRYETELDPKLDYVYRVRFVNADDLAGPWTEPITVTAESRGNPGGQEPAAGDGYKPVARELKPVNLEALVYGATTVELIWDRPGFPFQGYEIWVNGEFLTFTGGVSQVLRDLDADGNYQFEVVGITRDGRPLGSSFIEVTLGDADVCQ